MDGGEDIAVDEAGETERPTFGELLTRLVNEVRDVLKAELAVYRAEAGRAALSAGWIAGLLLGAVTLAQGALIALLVGLVWLFAPMIGTGWAIAAVTVGALVLAGLLGWLGVRRINRMIDPRKKS